MGERIDCGDGVGKQRVNNAEGPEATKKQKYPEPVFSGGGNWALYIVVMTMSILVCLVIRLNTDEAGGAKRPTRAADWGCRSSTCWRDGGWTRRKLDVWPGVPSFPAQPNCSMSLVVDQGCLSSRLSPVSDQMSGLLLPPNRSTCLWLQSAAGQAENQCVLKSIQMSSCNAGVCQCGHRVSEPASRQVW